MTMVRMNAVVFGDVQGVGYRAFVHRRAQMLGLRGWVRNVSDGSVELAAEGEESALHILLADLRIGPSLSRVERVDYKLQQPEGGFRGFSVRYD